MAKDKTEVKVVTVPKEEYDEMVRTNQENSAMIDQLVEKLDAVSNAQLAGVGIDPRIAARALLPRRRVQFQRKYSRAALTSKIQKGTHIVEAYSVSCGDIVDIREDEFKRLNDEYPELLEANPNKFREKPRMKPEQVVDKDTGRYKIEWVKDPQPVKVLEELAFEVG